MKKSSPLLAGSLGIVSWILLLTASCTSGPEPIRYGQDECFSCKMTLTDKRFGAEIVTGKGKVLKFDDLNCLLGYLNSGALPPEQVAQVVSVDFKNNAAFVDVQKAFFLQNEAIKSPMRADIATFSREADRDLVQSEVGDGKELTWNEVRKSLQ